MANNFRTVYLYIICIITLSMIVGGVVSTVNNIVSYICPDSHVFFEDNIEDEDIIEMRNYKNTKIKNSIVSVVVVAVGGIMYKNHWEIIEKERSM